MGLNELVIGILFGVIGYKFVEWQIKQHREYKQIEDKFIKGLTKKQHEAYKKIKYG